MNKKSFFFLILILNSLNSLSQVCDVLEPVCGNQVSQNNNAIDPSPITIQSSCQTLQGTRTMWFLLKVDTGTQLTFEIQPSIAGEDYDFAVFGPNPDCDNIGSKPALRASYASPSATGNTGLNTTANDLCETAAGDGFLRYLDVLPGEEYIVVVDRFSSTSSNFDLVWGNGTPGDPLELDCSIVETVDYCDGDTIYLDGTTLDAVSYIWDEDGTTLSETGPILSGILATETQYSVQAINTIGNVIFEQTFYIDVTAAPNAGILDPLSDICDDGSVNLNDGLTGEDLGGTWTELTSSGVTLSGADNNVFDTSTAIVTAGTYTFRYTVSATSPCTVDTTEDVDITVIRSPESGTATANLEVCSTSLTGPINLENGLTGADAGGVWTDSSSTVVSNMFDPTGLPTGTYNFTYTVSPVAGSPCVQSQTPISVEVTATPNAGILDPLSDICDDGSVNLNDGLTGEDLGGTWTELTSSGVTLSGTDNNIFDTSTAIVTAGTYTFRYTVSATSPCTADTTGDVDVTVIRSPDAGSDEAIIACSTGGLVDLESGLSGADLGGSWTDNNGLPVSNMFDPFGLATGNYIFTYSVAGTIPCADDEAEITVQVTAAPNAGVVAAIADICDDGNVNLNDGLTGEDLGGTWTELTSSGVTLSGTDNNIFDTSTAIVTAGTYTFRYTVSATSPCTADTTGDVDVTVIRSPDAGSDEAIIACSTGGLVDLESGLSGADLGGSWTDNNGLPVSNMFDPFGLATGNYIFTYTVTGTIPCSDDEAEITVQVTAAPNVGVVAAIADICDDGNVNLNDGLTGEDLGGTWTELTSSGVTLSGTDNNIFDTSTAIVTAGTYTFRYTVSATSPCTADTTGDVDVTVIRSPDAGDDNEVDVCMSDAVFNLYNLIGGTPDLVGTWSNGTGIFNPAVDPAGDYIYTVSGGGTCANDEATISVTLSEAPTITNVDISDFSDNNTITVDVEGTVSATSFGIGDYEYSIDGVSFQSDNIFEGVAPGNYVLTVRDANGCLPPAFRNISIIGAPKFFTPNNDFENDTWHVINLSQSSLINPNDGVSIFDRFGKLITTLYANSDGWDGYYNGEVLPSGDYWFSVLIKDSSDNPVLKRGHFSLIRR